MILQKNKSILTTDSIPQNSSQTLLATFFDGRSQQTLKAYKTDIENFKKFLNVDSLHEATNLLLLNGHGNANQVVLSYRSFLVNSKLQPTTINRRLSSIRSLVTLARTIGIIPWELEVKNLKTEAYRDTRGPGQSNFIKILHESTRKRNAKSIRDYAILRLLYDLALRASEVINIDIADVDLTANTVSILGKGRTQKEILALPEPTKIALINWIEIRHNPSNSPDALFLNFDRTNKGRSKRLTRIGLYQLVRNLGDKLNIKTRPHGIRHTAITEAVKLAQLNGFGLEEVLDFSRHSNVETLMVYRDRDENIQGKISDLIANKIKPD